MYNKCYFFVLAFIVYPLSLGMFIIYYQRGRNPSLFFKSLQQRVHCTQTTEIQRHVPCQDSGVWTFWLPAHLI